MSAWLLCVAGADAQSDSIRIPDNKVGCVSGDCTNGTGVYRTSNGNLFSGSFFNGKFQGKGKLTYKDGGIYEGDFVNGKMQGNGVYSFRDGKKYDGSFFQGKMEGKGTLVYDSGNRYEGTFVNNMKNGSGIFWYADSSRYEGNFSNDVMDGHGTLYYANEDRYSGTFIKGKQTGKGTYFYHDGNRYEGDFIAGIFTGKGAFYMSDGSYYEGDFKDDKQSGEGIWYYINGDIYAGTLLNGSYNGCGTYYYSSGDVYSGDYLNNQYHGTGTFTSADGVATQFHYDHGTIVNEGLQVFVPTVKPEPVVKKEIEHVTDVKPATNVENKKEEKPKVETPAPAGTNNSVAGKVESKPAESNVEVASARTDVKPGDALPDQPVTGGTVCPVCKGKGKIFQSEIRKNKMVTKDISNGIGPRNFVTYTVNELVRPAGNVTCGRCNGTGKITD